MMLSFGSFVSGMMFGRHPIGRGIALASMVVLVTILLVFGDELLSGKL